MEKFSSLKTENKGINYHGKGTEFALIYLKNFILTLFSLGLYYPWAKIDILKYHSNSLLLNNSNFSFNGDGKKIFKSFIKVYLVLFVGYLSLLLGLQSQNTLLQVVSFSLFYLFILIIIPFIIHGAINYRASKTLWKGVSFKYLGNKIELFWKFITGMLLTFLTLGIYSSWFQIEIRKYIISHLRFGNLSFNFTGKGETLFLINLKFLLLFPITLGIYTFWYFKNLLEFYINSIEVIQNGKQTSFKITLKIGDVLQLLVINFLLIILTLGIATPWVIVRTYTFIFNFLEIDSNLDTNAIQQTNYNNNTNQGFLDLDLV